MFDVLKGAYAEKNKSEGKNITKETMVPYLTSFFHNGRQIRRDAVRAIKQRLDAFQAALEHNDSFRFYSTSLLLIYEGAEPATHPEAPEVRCDVRMIDFAHVHVLEEDFKNDDGYAWGLDNLVHLIGQI